MKPALPVILAIAATSAAAETKRDLGAHEHGVGSLNIAFDGETVAMEFVAPGADIVGFEYEAESDIDRATVDAAVAALARPLELFMVPAEAACSVTQASAELETEDDHDEHDHGEEHAEGEEHDDHDHGEEHAEDEEHDDHDHGEEHAEGEEHDDHDHGEEHAEGEEHDDHDHGEEHAEHDHDDHAEEASHTEFHANYTLNCGNPTALIEVNFAYFDTFPNALEVEVQVLTAAGAQAFEVERDAPVLSLAGLF
ncbi:MAG: DUF2796 domain-containing protein [Pseudomonadota bacterium]